MRILGFFLFLGGVGAMLVVALSLGGGGDSPLGALSGDDAGKTATGIGQALKETKPMLVALAALFGVFALVAAIGGGTLATLRMRNRHRRRVERYQIIPFRSDEATPDQVRRLLESWHQQLLERWRTRPITGQPAIGLEVVMSRDDRGMLQGRLLLSLPTELVRAVSGSLRACYPNARLVPWTGPIPDPPAMLRLKKRESFIQALHMPGEDEPVITDELFAEMAAQGAPSVVQIMLTPTPSSFDFHSRRQFRARERAAIKRRSWDRSDPGLGSELLSRELEAGLLVQHRPLFFADIRVGAETPEACREISGIMRGATGGENRLVMRPLYHPGRLNLYKERMRRGLSNPIPSWQRGVYASTEVAGLWRMPSPGLASVPIVRSSVPRVEAPPEISRDPAHTILRDDYGQVGIRPQDKSDGLGLIGGQKTGKTSVLCRTVQVDAADPDCAMIVLMPKPGDAIKALSMVPTWRTVHYLDFEAPEFGINPLLAAGDAAMVADKVVEAFRDINMEGDIKGSSDRFLRQAAQAAIGASRAGAIEGPPNLWHMYRMLLPNEEAFREHVVRSIYTDSRFTDTATFFGRDLPTDLVEARVNTASKLDAPRNKILRLMVEALDKVLRHPRQLDLDSVVRNREILVVDGKMGTFGSDNCRVMMQFILNMLYGTLQRQQQLPEAERVRVAVKVDEAHLIINDSFADALATLRSAGLEVVAAWQYGEQIQDPKIRAGMMSLLRQRCMFSMGESADAREMTEIAMSVYTDMIRPEPESRSRLRFTPDTIFNMPNHHTLCTWISQGARAPAFVGQTIPLQEDPAIIEHHLEAQRARGGFVPTRLPDPLPEVDNDEMRELPIAEAMAELVDDEPEQVTAEMPVVVREAEPALAGAGTDERAGHSGLDDGGSERNGARGGNGGGGRETGGDEPAGQDGGRTEQATPSERPPRDAKPVPVASAPGRPPQQGVHSGKRDRGAPDSYTELDLDDVRGIDWDDIELLDPAKRPEPGMRELEIIASLWRYRVLFSTQIWRRWWSDSSLRAAQQGMNKMARAGWVRRARLAMGQRGSQQRMYFVTKEGFEVARGRVGPHGTFIDASQEWREPQIGDPRRLLRDLHANGWVLALQALAPHAVKHWRGPREARLMPPRRKVRGEWVDLRPQDLTVGGSRQVDGLALSRLEPVAPDAAVEIRLAIPGSPLRFDLLVEVERGRGGASREAKLQRYDALISGWARMLDRYKTLKTPPVSVFVAEDEPSAIALVKLADRLVTGRLAKVGTDETEWPYPARRGIFVVCERDIHMGSLTAYQMPEHPPEMRERLHGKDARPCQPRKVQLVEPKLLKLK